MNKSTPKKKERGAAAVELAILLPFLLLLIFGSIEFGLLMFNKQMLTNASREAARAGIVVLNKDGDRLSKADIESVAHAYCDKFLVTFDPVKLPSKAEVIYTGQDFGDDLTVVVTYDYEFLLVPNLMGLFGGSVGNVWPIGATTTMRYE